MTCVVDSVHLFFVGTGGTQRYKPLFDRLFNGCLIVAKASGLSVPKVV